MTEAVARQDDDRLTPVKIAEVQEQVALIQELMTSVMRKDEHYGIIPGTKKPSLLKSGAEKLGFTFRLTPEFDISCDRAGEHREYQVVCSLRSIKTGQVWGQGVGACSTMESKYRWRQSERACPSCGKETIRKSREDKGGGWYCWQKIGGCGKQFKPDEQAITSQIVGRADNPDIADTYNTVLKMAKKRAHVDAILTATAASDIFSQDLEDTTKPESPAAPLTQPVKDEGKESPESPAGDIPPSDAHAHAVEDWKLELAGAESVEKLAAIWKTLQKREVWVHFAGPEQVALTMAKDRRKGELTHAPAQGVLA